ncbi:MAG: DUF1844 domain-containing protein [bacterium]
MSEDNEKNKEDKKSYTVVDRRGQDEGVEEEEEEPAEAAEEETEEEEAERAGTEEARLMKVEEFLVLFMNLLREQAAISLGMSPHPSMNVPPRKDEAEHIASFYNKIMKEFGERFFPQLPQSPEGSPSFLGLTLSCLSILREQILINMGLLSNPVTGLIVKDLEQARLGIDLFTFIVQQSGALLPERERKELENYLTDFRINFMRQMNA